MEEQYDVVVIGAGFGGATCAALLARRGVRTLLIDKNAIPGGKALTMSKEGFRYEFWPICGGPSLNSRFAYVLEELGMQQEMEILTPENIGMLLYRPAGGEYRTQVTSAAPQAPSGGPMRLIDLLGITGEDLPEVARLFADMVQMPPEEIARLDDVTFAEFVRRYEVPRSVWSYLGMWTNIVFVVGIDLVAASEAVRTFQDFSRGGAMRYGSGGYGRLAEICCQSIERDGGRVLLKTRVERLRIEDGAVTGVITEHGTFAAPIVVSNAGIQPTVLRLAGEEHFDKGYVNYVKGLVPSWGFMGIRYFLDRAYFDRGTYIAFSDESSMDSESFRRARAGEIPDNMLVFNVVPSVYDPSLAPPGKQCALIGTICTPDPETQDNEAWWSKLEEAVARLWPDLEPCISSRERYGTYQVSNLTRDHLLPGQGGECIGLAQIVGQCGSHKPSAQAPVRGLYYVGCDAGGYGCGTHQAVDSGVNVAELVHRAHVVRASAY
jgi:phytoene dehydrogenase-like protein